MSDSALLSPHFSVAEMQCHCVNHELVMTAGFSTLLTALEQLRKLAGKPIHINDAYRCPAHNRSVGGELDSQHMSGRASDITIAGLSPEQIKSLAEQIPAFNNGGIGIYDSFVHVDCRPSGRARWDLRS